MPKYYLGIDVGYSKTKPSTGLCLITVEQDRLGWECHNTSTDRNARFESLRALIPERAALSGVGIDGPLVGEADKSRFKKVNLYRAADALLSGGLFEGLCKPAPTNSGDGQLHHHATGLANLVLRLQNEVAIANHPDAINQHRIVEAFPNAFLAFLLPINEIPLCVPRGEKSDRYWEVAVKNGYLQGLIKRLVPGRHMEGPPGQETLAQIIHHDHRAAFVCAMSAMCVEQNQYVAVGDPQYGDIILPPRKVWGFCPDCRFRWQERTLECRVGTVRSGRQHHRNARAIQNRIQWMPEP